jgi:N-acyl-L-homoserine lactone synthetase
MKCGGTPWQVQASPDHALAPDERSALAAFRARVFGEGLAWSEEADGRDAYDTLDPVHVMAREPDGRLRGYLRLLPTAGPCMLHEHFPALLPQGTDWRGPGIWEVSRFVATSAQGPGDVQLECPVTARALVGAALDEARALGAHQLVGVATWQLISGLLPLLEELPGQPSLHPHPPGVRGIVAFSVILSADTGTTRRVGPSTTT